MNINDTFINVAKNGHVQLVKLCLTAGADIHANSDRALRWAYANGHLPVVKYLVKAGANISALNYDAVFWARLHDHLQVIE